MTATTTSTTSRHRGRRGGRLAVGVLVTATAAALLAPQAPSAEAATAVRIGGCSVAADARLEGLVAAGPDRATLVVGPADMAYVRELETRANTTASSPEGMRTRQQLRHADTALAAPLPSTKDLSLGARASAERMLRLRYAAEVVADGRSQAVSGGVHATSADRYTDRIVQELLTWARMGSWGASGGLREGDSLLEAAEVGTTVALGYGLVREDLSPDTRRYVQDALTTKLLGPACTGWSRKSWMTDSPHNWGVVVNSGAAMAAMVVAERDPRVAAAALGQALPRVGRAVGASGADGGSYEGPNYAVLSHRYLAYLSASMDLTYGSKGLSLVPSVPGAARFYLHATGPSGRPFAYSDANSASMMPWLPLFNARHGGDRLGDWLGQRKLAEGHPDTLLLLWTRAATTTPTTAETVRRTFSRSGVATMRSSWSGGATWVGVKGGWNDVNHSHLDLGGLVVESKGQRFVDDPGQDSYALPGYLSGSNRFSYWRRSTAGHSTIARTGVNQPLAANASLTDPTVLSGGRRQVVVDMTKPLQAVDAERRVILQGETVTVQDVARFRGTTALRWRVQTQAGVRLERGGRSAVLSIGGKSMELRLGSSTAGSFVVRGAPAAPKGGVSTAGWRSVDLDLRSAPGKSGTSTSNVVVAFIPR